MRSLLFRGTEYVVVVTVVTVIVGAGRVVPRALDFVTGRPPADERLITAAGSNDPAEFDAALAAAGSARGRDPAGTTALMVAATTGHVGRADRLIALGAEVDAADRWGQTPLMFAAANDHPEVIRLLLRHGADPGRRDRAGWVALDRARDRDAGRAAAALSAGGGSR